MMISVLMFACKPQGNIVVNNIVEPDNIKPEIFFHTTAPAVMNGSQDFDLDFEVTDNKEIDEVILSYSPDGTSLPYTQLATFGEGRRTIKFCPPNQNHVKPTFKIFAKDKKNNEHEETLGLYAGKNFTIAITEPALPTITSSVGVSTTAASTLININTCDLADACSTGALYYEVPTNDTFIAVSSVQPVASAPSWVACDDVKTNGYPVALSTDGNLLLKIWSKSDDLGVSTISTPSQNITIYHDGTPPVPNLDTVPTTMTAHTDFTLQYDLSDAESGLASGKIFYTSKKTDLVNHPYVELGAVTAGANNTVKFCVPNKNHPDGAFKIVGTDVLGNTNALYEVGGFTVTRSSNNLLPTVTGVTTATRFTAGKSNISIDACKVNTCSVGAYTNHASDNNVFIAVGTTAPAAGSALWISCADVLANGYDFDVPVSTGASNYTTAKLWVKSENLDIDASTTVSTISTVGVGLTIPYDYDSMKFLTTAGVMNSHTPFSLSFNLANPATGLASAKLYYSPNSTDLVTYPFVDMGNLAGGSPEVVNFCVPHKTHPNGTFRLRAVDSSGRVAIQDTPGFTITKTADPVLPLVTKSSLASPLSTGVSRVWVDACAQNTCAGSAYSYAVPDNDLHIAIAAAQPTAGAASWVACSDVAANGYPFSVPTVTGKGNYTTAKLWVKSSNLDLNGVTPVATVSAANRALSLPYDYESPVITNLNLGNLGTGLNLEILVLTS